MGKFCLQKILSHRGMSYVAINCLHVGTANLLNLTSVLDLCCAWLHSIPPMQPPFSHFQGSQSTNKRACDTAPDMWTSHKYSDEMFTLRIILVSILVLDLGQQHPRALAVGSKEDRWRGAEGNAQDHLYSPPRTSAQLRIPTNHSPLLFWAFSHWTHTLYSKAYNYHIL